MSRMSVEIVSDHCESRLIAWGVLFPSFVPLSMLCEHETNLGTSPKCVLIPPVIWNQTALRMPYKTVREAVSERGRPLEFIWKEAGLVGM